MSLIKNLKRQAILRLTPRWKELTIGDTTASFVMEEAGEYVRFNPNQWGRLFGEQPVVKEVMSLTDEDNIFWDVGANIGTYSCFVGQCVSHVVAFEPHCSTASRLRENLVKNKVDSDVVAAALSDEFGVTRLEMADNTVGAGGHQIGNVGQTVPCLRGDSLDVCAPDIVKIDVEGAEIAVVRGMRGILDDISHLFIEVHNQSNLDALADIVDYNVFYERNNESFVHVQP